MESLIMEATCNQEAKCIMGCVVHVLLLHTHIHTCSQPRLAVLPGLPTISNLVCSPVKFIVADCFVRLVSKVQLLIWTCFIIILENNSNSAQVVKMLSLF